MIYCLKYELFYFLKGEILICIATDLPGSEDAFKEFRGNDGFFTGRRDEGQNTRVSAAFITKINPGNWESAEYWIMENQKALKPLDLRKSPLITRFIEENIIYRTQGKPFGEIIE